MKVWPNKDLHWHLSQLDLVSSASVVAGKRRIGSETEWLGDFDADEAWALVREKTSASSDAIENLSVLIERLKAVSAALATDMPYAANAVAAAVVALSAHVPDSIDPHGVLRGPTSPLDQINEHP